MQKVNGKLFDDSNSFDVIFSSITIQSLSDSTGQTFSKFGRAGLVFPTHAFGTTEAQDLLIRVAECVSPIYRNNACTQKYSYIYKQMVRIDHIKAKLTWSLRKCK